jgi:hypothetical protein
MANPTNDENRPSGAENEPDLQALYAKFRAEFTAAELQKYTEIEEGIPLEEVIAEMEAIHRKFQQENA